MKTQRNPSVTVRVSYSTRERLLAEASRLARAAEAGREVNVEYQPERIALGEIGVSTDAVVRYLLDFRARHRERVQRAKTKKKR